MAQVLNCVLLAKATDGQSFGQLATHLGPRVQRLMFYKVPVAKRDLVQVLKSEKEEEEMLLVGLPEAPEKASCGKNGIASITRINMSLASGGSSVVRRRHPSQVERRGMSRSMSFPLRSCTNKLQNLLVLDSGGRRLEAMAVKTSDARRKQMPITSRGRVDVKRGNPAFGSP